MILGIQEIADRCLETLRGEYEAEECLDDAVQCAQRAHSAAFEAGRCGFAKHIDLALGEIEDAIWPQLVILKKAAKELGARIRWLEDEHTRIERLAEACDP